MAVAIVVEFVAVAENLQAGIRSRRISGALVGTSLSIVYPSGQSPIKYRRGLNVYRSDLGVDP